MEFSQGVLCQNYEVAVGKINVGETASAGGSALMQNSQKDLLGSDGVAGAVRTHSRLPGPVKKPRGNSSARVISSRTHRRTLFQVVILPNFQTKKQV